MNYLKSKFLAVGIASAALVSTTILLNQTSVDAASATANSGYGQVELWNNINGSRTRDNNTLTSGSSWSIGNLITSSNGQKYYKVGKNQYASANQMDTSTENSKQKLIGAVESGSGNGNYVVLYTNPLNGAHRVRNRGLMKYTDWYTDQRVIVNGEVYYRVATNEWTKGSDSNLISEKYRGDKIFLSGNYSNNTDKNNENQKPYLNVTYTTKYMHYTYSLKLMSNGEYIYNINRLTTYDATPGIDYQKGTYTVNDDGSINFTGLVSSLIATWGSYSGEGQIPNTAPRFVHFEGQGSEEPNQKISSTELVKSEQFRIVNNGSTIKSAPAVGMTLTPQSGASIIDPEQVGQSFVDKYNAAYNY